MANNNVYKDKEIKLITNKILNLKSNLSYNLYVPYLFLH